MGEPTSEQLAMRARVIGWGLHEAVRSLRACAIIERSDGVRTACRGGWDARDNWAWFPGGVNEPIWPRCAGCCDLLGVPADNPQHAPTAPQFSRHQQASVFEPKKKPKK